MKKKISFINQILFARVFGRVRTMDVCKQLHASGDARKQGERRANKGLLPIEFLYQLTSTINNGTN